MRDTEYLNRLLDIQHNFDIISRKIQIGGKDACMYLVDGFCKDELIQKLLQYFMDLTPEKMPNEMKEISQKFTPYVEVTVEKRYHGLIDMLLAGMFVLLIDGYQEALLIDSRTYPASVEEPEKDKVLRGSKDGFVETIVYNTALIRRRIRSTSLHMEILNAGRNSKTDIVLCYMNDRVDQQFLNKIRKRINEIDVDSLTMNQNACTKGNGIIHFQSSNIQRDLILQLPMPWKGILLFW